MDLLHGLLIHPSLCLQHITLAALDAALGASGDPSAGQMQLLTLLTQQDIITQLVTRHLSNPDSHSRAATILHALACPQGLSQYACMEDLPRRTLALDMLTAYQPWLACYGKESHISDVLEAIRQQAEQEGGGSTWPGLVPALCQLYHKDGDLQEIAARQLTGRLGMSKLLRHEDGPLRNSFEHPFDAVLWTIQGGNSAPSRAHLFRHDAHALQRG